MPERPVVSECSTVGMTIDHDSMSNIVVGQVKNMFCGVMHIPSRTIYFAPLSSEGDKKYGSRTPGHLDAFPMTSPVPPGTSRKLSSASFTRITGAVVAPIVHDSATTSHDQWAAIVSRTTGKGTVDDYCGFALRLESRSPEGRYEVDLSPTSRTLNPLENGRLEQCIFDAVFQFLKRTLALLNMNLRQVEATTSPTQAAAQRIANGTTVSGRTGLIPLGLTGQLKAGFALKKVGSTPPGTT